MNKAKEIILSWTTRINPTELQKNLAEKRLEICMACENWREKPIEHCFLCKCVTSAKVFSPLGKEACPEKKWEE